MRYQLEFLLNPNDEESDVRISVPIIGDHIDANNLAEVIEHYHSNSIKDFPKLSRDDIYFRFIDNSLYIIARAGEKVNGKYLCIYDLITDENRILDFKMLVSRLFGTFYKVEFNEKTDIILAYEE